MRDKLFRLAEILESVFMDPIQFIDLWESGKVVWKGYRQFFSIVSAISISIGSSYISPPYSREFYIPIVLAIVANYLVISFLPILVSSLVDSFAQGKERIGKSKLMSDFVGISVSTLLLYTPICIIFASVGLVGFLASIILLILSFALMAIINARAIKYIYDLKDRDALVYSFKAMGILIVYPMIFNFYLTSYIINFTL